MNVFTIPLLSSRSILTAMPQGLDSIRFGAVLFVMDACRQLTRFGKQDSKIQTPQTEIKKLTEGQEKFHQETTAVFQKVEAKDQKTVQKDFQTALTNSIQENSKKKDSNFPELKALFRQPKGKGLPDAAGGSDEDM